MSKSNVSLIVAANSALILEGDLGSVNEFFSPNYVVHITGRDISGGYSTVRKIVREYRNAFSNFQIDVEILVKARDRVAWQRTLRANHKGSFKGFPATGRPLVWRDMVTSRFEEGLIAEEWVITDLAEQLLLARKR